MCIILMKIASTNTTDTLLNLSISLQVNGLRVVILRLGDERPLPPARHDSQIRFPSSSTRSAVVRRQKAASVSRNLKFEKRTPTVTISDNFQIRDEAPNSRLRRATRGVRKRARLRFEDRRKSRVRSPIERNRIQDSIENTSSRRGSGWGRWISR